MRVSFRKAVVFTAHVLLCSHTSVFGSNDVHRTYISKTPGYLPCLTRGDKKVLAAKKKYMSAEDEVELCALKSRLMDVREGIEVTKLYKCKTRLMGIAGGGKIPENIAHVIEDQKCYGDYMGRSALMIAVEKRNIKMVQMLINDEGGLQSASGCMALIYAVKARFIEAIPLLIPKEVGMRSVRGYTALYFACFLKLSQVIEMLVPYESHILCKGHLTVLEIFKQRALDGRTPSWVVNDLESLMCVEDIRMGRKSSTAQNGVPQSRISLHANGTEKCIQIDSATSSDNDGTEE